MAHCRRYTEIARDLSRVLAGMCIFTLATPFESLAIDPPVTVSQLEAFRDSLRDELTLQRYLNRRDAWDYGRQYEYMGAPAPGAYGIGSGYGSYAPPAVPAAQPYVAPQPATPQPGTREWYESWSSQYSQPQAVPVTAPQFSPAPVSPAGMPAAVTYLPPIAPSSKRTTLPSRNPLLRNIGSPYDPDVQFLNQSLNKQGFGIRPIGE